MNPPNRDHLRTMLSQQSFQSFDAMLKFISDHTQGGPQFAQRIRGAVDADLHGDPRGITDQDKIALVRNLAQGEKNRVR